jgi:phosphoserine phosphatase RsbU/P
MNPNHTGRALLPDAVVKVLEEFGREFGLDIHFWAPSDDAGFRHLFPAATARGADAPRSDSILLEVPSRNGQDLVLEVRRPFQQDVHGPANVLRTTLEHLLEYAEEVRYFTHEVSERYEEINLLYSISETLGSVLELEPAARIILGEVCDVLGARRGSLWTLSGERLHLIASVGDGGLKGPLEADDKVAVTSRVHRDGRSLILTSDGFEPDREVATVHDESVLSVPIRYTPPAGDPRGVGVINLIGRRGGGRFSPADEKLLAAIASQVGAALENHRLLRESVERERVTREMELAHDLQMKLLPTGDAFDPEVVAARVEPAEVVGGDFYHFLRLSGGRYGVMIGDVSSHGFPAALIMALSMSAATIYASEVQAPAQVLSEMSRSLRDELETTEMYLTLFYAVVDPGAGKLTYANAGHPHAFVIREDGEAVRLGALDAPIGIAESDRFQEEEVAWERGKNVLLLFTDGLSENQLPGTRAGGEERVVREAARVRGEVPESIVEALFSLEPEGGEGEVEPDDRTAIVLKV